MYYIGMITIFFSFFILVTVAYWLVYPYEIIKTNSSPSFDKNEYRAGDSMIYFNDYCKYVNIPSTVTVRFVDTVVYSMPTFRTNLPLGCRKTQGLLVAPNLPTGKYHVEVMYSYNPNPVRTIEYLFESNEFYIVK
jgi:hypothetical protein